MAILGDLRARPCLLVPRSWVRLAVSLAAGWIALPAEPTSPAAAPPQLTSQWVELSAPDAACIAYLETFAQRQWVLGVTSPAAFGALLERTSLSAATRAALVDPAWWPSPSATATARPSVVLQPPLALLQSLRAAERRELYHLLAQWTPNKPERWPLVFRDEAAISALASADLPPGFVTRVRALAYPFPGGWALSDFSVLAAEFPDPAPLLRFLRAASTVRTRLPRLNLRTAGSVVSVLDYWTVNRRNPFAAPLLEALLEANSTTGVDLVSVLPSANRVLSDDLDPEDVKHDFSLTSYLMASSIAEPDPPRLTANEYFVWFDAHFVPTSPPYRFGDVLTLEHRDGTPQPVALACAYLSDQLVFAKDPVGLGLWRFLSLDDLLARNPNHADCFLQGYRALPPPS